MFFSKSLALALAAYLLSAISALPIKREVPQEHSHQQFLTTVQKSLLLNNPDGIVDSVFGLLGNAAAAGGQGKITDTDCLQQATADQAFTNAKAAGDVAGMTAALIYRALERNTGKVGLASAPCTSIKAVNPEIAAIQQHQDPASSGAAATNKAITLMLAQQIASVGGNPQDALKSGTFAPGNLNDNTGKGNTCDDANDAVGCIFTQNLLVEDASVDEINAAVSGGVVASVSASPSSLAIASSSAAVATSAAAAVTSAAPAAANSAAAASGNLQTFTGNLGGPLPPAVTVGGRGFVVEGSDDFLNIGAALQRSCDIQHNVCANAANSGGGFSVGQCDQQDTACTAAAKGATAPASPAAATSAVGAATSVIAPAASSTAAATNGNLQPFTGNLGGSLPPAVTAGGRGFIVEGSDQFVNLAAALQRSCDIQHNACANAANSGGGFSVGQCDQQDTACVTAGKA